MMLRCALGQLALAGLVTLDMDIQLLLGIVTELNLLAR